MSPLSLLCSLQAATLFLAANAARVGARNHTTSGISWQPCPDDVNAVAALPVDCGTLAVPFDYTDAASTETIDLSLVRVPAARQPAQHSILFNFGGPGLEVRHTLAELADMLQVVTGGEHDLIGWDPRGVADTFTFSCFANATDRVDITGQLGLGNSSDTERGVIWAAGKNYADACAEYPDAQKKGPLIGSSTTAHDAMQIVDAVEEDGLLRFWGLSYGTSLGALIAGLFPDRIDKVVLDGVLNPIEYFNGKSDIQGYASSDVTLLEFFKDCLAAPELCTLAKNFPNTTAEQFEAATFALLEELKYRPIGYQGDVLGYDELKTGIRFALYAPRTWLALDPVLAAFLAEPRNETLAATALVAAVGSTLAADGSGQGNDAPIGIECVDKWHRTNSYDDYAATLDEAQSVSRLLGDVLATVPATCGQWKLEPHERFIGKFGDIKPRSPLLVIGNTYDPVTSIVSAKNISETIKGSRFLEHGGVGHTSIQQPSLCTARALQNYFRNGTLPAPNTACKPVEANAFRFATSGPTWQDLFPQLGFKRPNPHGGNSTQAGGPLRRRRHTVGNPIVDLGRRQASVAVHR
ncbi:TAP-like protein-domain-containing protein [Xylaria sp. CBS 124048]|nr:TAP-like protein-domain-containing protein [Xylaria sp. CBS 124048]